MKFVLTAIYDKKGQIFSFPETKKSTAVATRDFQSICEDTKLGINKYPEDYCLCVIGEFDNETGKINAFKETKILNEAENFVIKPENIEVKK